MVSADLHAPSTTVRAFIISCIEDTLPFVAESSPTNRAGRSAIHSFSLGLLRLSLRRDECVVDLFRFHIDEINNNQSAHVSQAQLPCSSSAASSLPAESTLLRFSLCVDRIYIDRNEGFGFIKDEIGTRLKPYFASIGRFDLFLDIKIVKNRSSPP